MWASVSYTHLDVYKRQEEMECIRLADKNCRLVKGQVFLWEGANGWEDLWDTDGRIAGS